ncbi:unnamed protein product [Zymoseptoria tritici ST99CH_3D1]|nr:unnamed protein product [Zymoseptoria tritici ST99CH_3D1]
MAQGPAKKAKAAAPKATQRKQTGNRVIKPKKAALIKQNTMKKKHSSGLSTLTEKTLATKAGHLELLRGGKKDRQAAEAAKAAKAKNSTTPLDHGQWLMRKDVVVEEQVTVKLRLANMRVRPAGQAQAASKPGT